MRIAIDMRPLQSRFRFRGVALHIRRLVEAIASMPLDHKFALIYARSPEPLDSGFQYPDNFEHIEIRGKLDGISHLLLNWAFDRQAIARLLHKFSADFFMCTTFAEMWLPPPKFVVPTAVWVYDTIFFKFPELYVRSPHDRIKMRLWRGKLKNAATANAVIVSSQAVKDDFCNETECPPQNVHVVHLGVDKAYFGADPKHARLKFNLPGRFALYIGGLDPRKNIDRMLEAYALAGKNTDMLSIVIAGKCEDDPMLPDVLDAAHSFGVDNRLKFIGFVPDELLPSLYSSAEFLLFPSLYEGFGLPVLEAMASGCPVLTSNVSALPEITADKAILVNPYDINDIAKGIERLTNDSELRNKLSNEGRERAKLFTWERTATQFLHVLHEI